LVGTLHFANIAISYRCLNPACLTGNFFFLFSFGLKVIGWWLGMGRGRLGALLSAVEGAGQLHLLGYFDPFFLSRGFDST